VAGGGWDAAQKAFGGDFVYVFDTATGAIAARLGPLGNVIHHLAVSPDSRYLAATLGSGEGLRVWERTGARAATWRLVLEDRDYGGQDSYGAIFSRDGTLYTVAYDGKIRRYGPGFSGNARPYSGMTRGGQLPFSIAVNAAGNRLAVGYTDNTRVEVYDAPTLSWRFAADTNVANNGDMASVSWGGEGDRLYAGGRYVKNGFSPIISWDRGGEGRPWDMGGPRDTVLHVLPCGNGIIVGAGDPAFALLDPNAKVQGRQGPVQPDFRGQRGEKGFSVSVDGRRVRFGLDEWGGRPLLFDLAAEQLRDAPDRPAELTGPDTTSLNVTNWVNNRNPMVDGRPITLERFEEARSLAIAPGAQSFVLGSSWSLRSFDRTGRQLWRQEVPGTTWGVNVTRDGKVVVVGYGDGTLRWHRQSDGEELLALFVHKVDRRWVAWTPKGYYMASPGAESLIGWHVNGASWDQAAAFFPADRFREQFNRPDIVRLVLETLDEGRAVDAANSRSGTRRAVEDVRKIAPPVIVIRTPGDGANFRSTELTIEYEVFSPTGRKITNVQYFVNNAAARANFEPPVDKGKSTFAGRVTLTLQPEDTTVTLVAYEDERASEPVSIRLRWDGARPGQVALPRLRALFVGVDGYTSSSLGKLKYARKDAKDLAAFFTSHETKSYGKVEAKVLQDAKREDVLAGLDWLQKGSEQGDVNLLFLAGHGATIDQEFYFMAADSDPNKARSTAVSTDDIQRAIRRRKGTMVVMLDACRSGAGTDTSGGSPVDMNRAPNELGDKATGVLLYASASGRQYSYERAEWENGAFTKAIIEGLSGMADIDKNGFVESDELDYYVRRRVTEMTKGQQVPVRVKPDAAPEMKMVLLNK
jgi:WD40 repeat protein